MTNAPTIPSKVTDMSNAFEEMIYLETPPTIPTSVVNMAGTFYDCIGLKSAPIIPSNVSNIKETFAGCTSLVGDVWIESNRINNTSMQNCFYFTDNGTRNVYMPGTGLDTTNNSWNAAFNSSYGINGKNGVTVYDINAYANECFTYTTNSTATLVTKYKGTRTNVVVPSMINGQNTVVNCEYTTSVGMEQVFANKKAIKSVIFGSNVRIANNNMYYMFKNCSNLQYVSGVPAGVNNMTGTFYNCLNLTQAPVIPNGITSIGDTFYNCQNLTQTPVIPNSVTNMSGAFAGCIRITQSSTIPNSVTNMCLTFSSCSNLVKTSNIPNSVGNMRGTFSYCTNLVNAPIIGNAVYNMSYTFSNCSSLTGNVVIKSNRVSNIRNCFLNTSLAKKVYIPTTGYNTSANTWSQANSYINGKNGVTIYDINTYTGAM